MKALLVALFLWPLASAAIESSAPDGFRPSSGAGIQSLLKPRHVFDMRGRRDPFAGLAHWAPAGSLAFSISGLEFKGVMEVDGVKAAIFISGVERALYTLRGNRLYGSNQKPVPGVTGSFIEGKGATLRQGELSLAYSAKRLAKRKY